MNRTNLTAIITTLVLIAGTFLIAPRLVASHRAETAILPAPSAVPLTTAATADQTAVFAGGCFWGIEAVFEHLKGVKSATSGYAGGTTASPSYDDVSSGRTGHAEAVQVVYDPALISYETLLHVFFSVAHDPTQLNRQGPDVGTQYRSAIFYDDDAQRASAEDYIKELTKAKAFDRPIVTEVARLQAFYPAEEYHQNYMARHPNSMYIVINDAPKVEHLRRQFPALYTESPRD